MNGIEERIHEVGFQVGITLLRSGEEGVITPTIQKMITEIGSTEARMRASAEGQPCRKESDEIENEPHREHTLVSLSIGESK
jgi:hypothetical protein